MRTHSICNSTILSIVIYIFILSNHNLLQYKLPPTLLLRHSLPLYYFKMKFSQVALPAVALFAAGVSAFPAIQRDALAALARKDTANMRPRLLQERDERRKKKRATTFNAAEQYIDVTGANAFVPPDFAAGDQRGPCPGLNALANHNFLPHNGVAEVGTIISAVNTGKSFALMVYLVLTDV